MGKLHDKQQTVKTKKKTQTSVLNKTNFLDAEKLSKI